MSGGGAAGDAPLSPTPSPTEGGEGRGANPARGEAAFAVAGGTLALRPSFEALVAAEEELGPLFALVERAADGRLKLSEMSALFWHCAPPGSVSREQIGAAIVERGLAGASPVLKVLLGQILQGLPPPAGPAPSPIGSGLG